MAGGLQGRQGTRWDVGEDDISITLPQFDSSVASPDARDQHLDSPSLVVEGRDRFLLLFLLWRE